MSTKKHTCCKLKPSSFGFRGKPCNKPAKVEHEGEWYCGIHDPVKKKAKQDTRFAEWEAKRKREAERRKAAAEALERANGSCEWKETKTGVFETGCKSSYYSMSNPMKSGVQFCCFCGKRIEFVKYKLPDAGE